MLARIYSPAKTAMQSGKARTNKWLLVFAPQQQKIVEPFMRYTSSQDMLQQIKLWFDSCAEAIAYAKRENLPYIVQENHAPRKQKMSYADNFVSGRVMPWTH